MTDPASRTRVFVVEDQPQLLKNLLKVLSTFPELDVVGSAQEGEAAVDEVVKLKPQLLLLDLELPGIDGIEVTRRVKRRANDIEVLILTSFDDETKVYEAIQAGASGYLVKRVGPEKIRSGIREVMEGGTVLEPIIAVTARALPAEEARARAIGCDDFVTKPLDIARLRDAIRAVLRKDGP